MIDHAARSNSDIPSGYIILIAPAILKCPAILEMRGDF
jgi:hypothetical protein